jgi:hypothetical protein
MSNHFGCWNVGYCFLSRSGVFGLVRRHLLEIPIQNLTQGRRVAPGSETEPEKKSSQQQGNNPDDVPVDQDNYAENSAYCGS